MPVGLQDVDNIRQSLIGIVQTSNLVSAIVTGLNNGDVLKTVLTCTGTATDVAGKPPVKILGVADWTYYVGSVADANAIPIGASVDISQWQYIPPVCDWGLTNNKNIKVVACLRNISAGTVNILERIYVRFISNTITRTAVGSTP
jgi:hypothetical protein